MVTTVVLSSLVACTAFSSRGMIKSYQTKAELADLARFERTTRQLAAQLGREAELHYDTRHNRVTRLGLGRPQTLQLRWIGIERLVPLPGGATAPVSPIQIASNGHSASYELLLRLPPQRPWAMRVAGLSGETWTRPTESTSDRRNLDGEPW
jgi:hypothetical protein